MLIVILSESAASMIDAAVSTAVRNAAGAASALASNSILMFIAPNPGGNRTPPPTSKPPAHLQLKRAILCDGNLRQDGQVLDERPALGRRTRFESDLNRRASGVAGPRYKGLREARAVSGKIGRLALNGPAQVRVDGRATRRRRDRGRHRTAAHQEFVERAG